jgi:3alpha(or 20beta)-hydroxysteroid dehydrogenase
MARVEGKIVVVTGAPGGQGAAEARALADLERVMAVNVNGALLGTQTITPLMGGGGSIVNVSSVAGLLGYRAVGYTISKWGIRALSRVAGLELGPRGIRVNARGEETKSGNR